VGIANKLLVLAIPAYYGAAHSFAPSAAGEAPAVVQDVTKLAAIWAVEGALLTGILSVVALAWKPVCARFGQSSHPAVAGALLASVNTASEYGFGAVIASLPGFRVLANALTAIPDPLLNEAVAVTTLAGVTGSASGGMSIALAALADTFIRNAEAAGIPLEVLHRIAAMASGGMDTLPHNGAVITLLTVTGLTHRQSYADIFAITLIKTSAVAVAILAYRVLGVV
jgi:H+/gluconate symporter-like permease